MSGAELRAFWLKFREGRLMPDDLLGDRVFWYGIFFPFIVPSFACMVLIDSEIALGSEATKIALGVFGIPMTIVFLLLNSRCLPRDPGAMFQVLRVVLVLLMAGVYSFSAIGYVSLWNALTGSGEAVLVRGPVVSMKAEGARWLGREYLVTIQHGGRAVELSILPQEYATLQPGDTYNKLMKLGGLGYYYSWGLAYWKNLRGTFGPPGQGG